MSFFYKNNLLNPFLFSLDRTRWNTPLCTCEQGDQTSVHLLTSCDFIEERLKDQASYLLQIGNCVENNGELPPANVAMVNCSRDPCFIGICKEIVENDRVNLRKKISLHQGSSLTRSTHTQLGSLVLPNAQCSIHWLYAALPRPVIIGQSLYGRPVLATVLHLYSRQQLLEMELLNV